MGQRTKSHGIEARLTRVDHTPVPI
ncbi:hypothetical protein F383_12601 [Gossypium arboreum]|uniref:Uncharacterized protein n=1 Tax=Gossypium arboreum TaxID=29729 RepID=A0A0B0Q1C8_GOSAR|nr:hypothetical protein F383_12601 [Gossypium arboreum]